ncbi:2'-5' RNA ligase family protein [Deinococcus detaillensis]|uniref:2'-5' RNA ligase family protein n=1 Tax=Deinococcus detaillensis TaxID=2592048 RepID=A0A553UMC0_9DEIO|nr:2'-5' RNA ligase family protein [Deinococcus detaillensis]TSA81151.1 2'-5' RNA ligase family protein [Deinococcus detaillensis]
MGLYSVVAWPTAELAEWLSALQRRLGVRSYGEAHLNLRAPFEYAGDPNELICDVRRSLAGVPPFQVEFLHWRRFPHVIFLEYALSVPLHGLHQRLIQVPGAPPSSYDGERFIPHVSLAIGVVDWAEESIWNALKDLRPPQGSFEVQAASLTKEASGELREVRTFPLGYSAVSQREQEQ